MPCVLTVEPDFWIPKYPIQYSLKQKYLAEANSQQLNETGVSFVQERDMGVLNRVTF